MKDQAISILEIQKIKSKKMNNGYYVELIRMPASGKSYY